MKHDVWIEDECGYWVVHSFRNESIAEAVFEAALKWGRVSFVLSYFPQ